MKAAVTQPEARSPGTTPTSQGNPFPYYFFHFEQRERARRLPATALLLLQRPEHRWEQQEHQLEQMRTRTTIGAPARPSAPLAAASGTALLFPLSLDTARSPVRARPPSRAAIGFLIPFSSFPVLSLRADWAALTIWLRLAPNFLLCDWPAAPFPSFPAR